jgi:hypothetical protein
VARVARLGSGLPPAVFLWAPQVQQILGRVQPTLSKSPEGPGSAAAPGS